MVTKKVLITGISGFVGPYLARKLLDAGHEVIGLIRFRSDHRKPERLVESHILPHIRLLEGDVTDLTSVLSAIQHTDPDWIFHLAAQSFVPQSFKDPIATYKTNCLGTMNILEAVRLKDKNSKMIFAGSSEEYGLQFKDKEHYERMKTKYGSIEPPPSVIPELPISEQGVLRPMSPYATSKVYGDFVFRNYHTAYGLNTVVSRAFNHEGAGRGPDFVTSAIVRQIVSLHLKESKYLQIGDIQPFRDWSHVEDTVNGYILLAEKGNAGGVYVQGSMRSDSVASYILNTISCLGYCINSVRTIRNEKKICDPLAHRKTRIGNRIVESNTIDHMLTTEELEFTLLDQGLIIDTDKREFRVQFEPSRFRVSDVPVLISNIEKIKQLGYVPTKNLNDIINEQINYYLDANHRNSILDNQ